MMSAEVEVHWCFVEIQDMGSAAESENASLGAYRELGGAMFPCYLLLVEVSLRVLRDWFGIQDC